MIRQDNTKTFAERLRDIRVSLVISQTELAGKTGLLPCAIGHFEAGRRKPSYHNIQRLACALNVSSDRLLGLVSKEGGE